jgi:hypothetical protein
MAADVPDPEQQRPARRPRLGGWGGCLLWVLAFFVVIVVGFSIGLVLRPDPDAPAQVANGQGWEVEVQNADDGRCIRLIIGNQERAGQCEFLVDGAYRATSYEVGGGQVVVFGTLPEGVASVRLRLADGSRPRVQAEEEKGVRYFVHVADGPDQGPTELLDASGNEVDPS